MFIRAALNSPLSPLAAKYFTPSYNYQKLLKLIFDGGHVHSQVFLLYSPLQPCIYVVGLSGGLCNYNRV